MKHCVKVVQIRSFFWYVFSCIQSQISVFSPNTGKYGTEKTLHLNSFQAEEILAKKAFASSLLTQLDKERHKNKDYCQAFCVTRKRNKFCLKFEINSVRIG